MTMKLGLGTYAFAWALGVPGYDTTTPMTGIQFIDKAHQLGVKLVQIADNLPLDQMSTSAFNALIARAHDYDISIEVGTRGIMHDHLRRYLDIAIACKSPILRVVIDSADHQPSPEQVVEILRTIIPEFERNSVVLAIENHDRFKVQVLADIVTALDSPNIGICLDTVNSFGSLEGPDVVINTLGRHVVNLHIKDFKIERLNHNMGFILEGTPAGQGMLDVLSVIKRLQAFDREFNAILELWNPYEGDLAKTIESEALWAQQSVIYLRTLIKE